MNVPEGWAQTILDNVLSGSEYGTSCPTIEGGTRPVVGMKDIDSGKVWLNNLAFLDEEAQNWSALELKAGDLLLNRTNSPDLVGKIGIVREDTRAVFASYLVRLNADTRVVDPSYLNYWLNGSAAQRVIKRVSTRGVSQANVNPSVLRAHCPVLVPPLSEQLKIAEILRTWDDAIEMITALRKGRAHLYKRLTEALIFDGTGKRETRQSYRLGDVTREITERNAASALGLGSVMGVSNLKGIVPMRSQTIGSDLTRYKILPPQGFAYNPMRLNVGSIAMSSLDEDILVSPDYVLFECIGGALDPDYLDHLRRTHWWHHHVNAGGSGSVRVRTYYDELASLRINLPTITEQHTIARALNTAREEIELIDAELAALRQQKRGLMQKLLTGQWRVEGEVTP